MEPTPTSGLLQRGRRAVDPGSVGHRVWRLPSHVDTDTLAPSRWMKYSAEVIARHCLESLRPQFALEVRQGDVIVAGANFGVGSSREQAASALVHLGIVAVIAPSFGGLFYRNAFNVGLPLLVCRDAEAIVDGQRVQFDLQSGVVRCVADADGRDLGERAALLSCEPIPAFLLELVSGGGLMAQLRRRWRRVPG